MKERSQAASIKKLQAALIGSMSNNM